MALLLSALILGASGCASSAPKQQDEIFVDTMTVPMDFESTWQLTRDTLLDKDIEIYTRDKRGLFVAYGNTRRSLLIPWRTKFTITIQEESAESTKIAIEAVEQRYTVTLLTYPDWRDRDFRDKKGHGAALLESIKSRIVQN